MTDFNSHMKSLMGKYPNKSRKVIRNIVRGFLSYRPGNIGAGEFSKINLRQTRRARSKRLHVPFNPRYNGTNPSYVKFESKNKYRNTL
jgi:hypothetical protein